MYHHLKWLLVYDCGLSSKVGLNLRPKWPSPHDCTSSVWDELKFIPIIGFIPGIEVGSTFFFPSLISSLPIKKNYSTTQAFQTPTTTYFPPSKTLNLVIIQKQKQCSKRWCYRSNGEVLLQKMMLHKRVEIMLQKQCWCSVIEDVAKVVLQKTFLQKKLVHMWQVSVHQPFFYLFLFHSCFFAQM